MDDNQNDICHLVNPEFSEHGYIQVYTGNGKGKTTASLGLATRALKFCKTKNEKIWL